MTLAICMVFGSASALPQSYFADNTSISASAESYYKYGNYNYTILSDGTVRITMFHNKEKAAVNVTIPSTINGRKVTSIGSSAFLLERIGAVTIPEGVTSIGYGAFRKSTATSISIPSTVTKIDYTAFNSCDNLLKVVVSSANKTYSSANGALLSKDGTELKYIPSAYAVYTIPNTVKTFAQYAVYNNNKIQILNIPDSVTSIKGTAIESNPLLKTINVGAGVTLLAGYPASGEAGVDFYHNLGNFAQINVSASNKTYASVDGALYNKSKSTLLLCPKHKNTISIPTTTTKIRSYAFKYNDALTNLYIPNSVKTIEEDAFLNCKALKSVILPYGLKTLESSVFYGCSSLAGITIPSGVTMIKASAFQGCSKLSTVVIPNTVTEIRGYAFEGCTALKDLYIPSSVTTLNNYALGSAKPVIYGKKSSQAETLAKNKSLTFKEISQNFTRFAGVGRYDTAKAISAEGVKSTSKTVVLASGLNYADALAGVPLATKLNAPILLATKNTLPDETIGEIKRLGAKTVYILGGEGAIAGNVDTYLKKNNIKVIRVAGKTRYETATKIAAKVKSAPTEIFFVYGLNYADALSASAVAAIKGAPIIYLQKNADLDAATASYLKSVKGKVKNAYVIGGVGVISDAVMTKAANALGLKAGSTVQRVFGNNRYSTCIAVNNKFKGSFTGKAVCVATGTNFPDALAGGVLAAAAKNKSPLLLADKSLSSEQTSYLKTKKPTQLIAFGGSAAVPNSLIYNIGAASK